MRFEVTAATSAVNPAYGAVVPMRFTIRNLRPGTCRLERFETLVGGRLELWRSSGAGEPIPEGESFTVEVPYRLLTTQEDMFLTFEPPDSRDPERGSGKIRMERAKVVIACPEEPFDSGRLERKFDSWTWSTALEGFVYRVNQWTITLVREDASVGLPPLPLRFLKDMDMHPEGISILLDNETTKVITAEMLPQFLAGLRARQARLQVSREPDRAPYEVLR